MMERPRWGSFQACVHAMLVLGIVGPMPVSYLCAQDKNRIPNALNRTAVDPAEDTEVKDREAGAPIMQFEMEPERWAEMAYGTLGGTRGNFEQSLRRRVRMALNRIEQLCGISEEVRLKVTATADLEFQRLDADIAALVADAPRRPTQEQYQTFYQKLWKICEPFQQIAQQGWTQDPLRPKPLWEKVLSSNLSEDQREVVNEDQKQRATYSDRVQRLETLLQVSRVLGLSSKQLRDLEAVGDANPAAWTSLETVWTTLAAMPETQQREYFTESQRIRLARPLEFTNDIRPVMLWEINP